MTFQTRPDDFQFATLSAALAGLSLAERLRAIRAELPGTLVFTTSFGLEDQALTHAVVDAGVSVVLATLDTGRLFDETLELWAETEMRYGIGIRSFAPEAPRVEDLLRSDGPLGFRASVAARKACCAVRKVEPLARALKDASGWLTGLRADQSAFRAVTPFVSFDADQGVTKINPLADWSREDVLRYIAEQDVPYNPLHDRGFLSIGCAPCTRAVRAGEPERAGRWWWESEEKRECGLHDRFTSTAATLPIPVH
jgi:phosphoadenosine phosphosulfate reductase